MRENEKVQSQKALLTEAFFIKRDRSSLDRLKYFRTLLMNSEARDLSQKTIKSISGEKKSLKKLAKMQFGN